MQFGYHFPLKLVTSMGIVGNGHRYTLHSLGRNPVSTRGGLVQEQLFNLNCFLKQLWFVGVW